MKIYYLDENPRTCAEMYSDMHIVKLPVSYLRIMSTVIGMQKPGVAGAYYTMLNEKDPAVQWANTSENFRWLVHATHMCCVIFEGTKGYQHKSRKMLLSMPSVESIFKNILQTNISTPPDFSWLDSYEGTIIEKHQKYYRKVTRSHNFTMNPRPSWTRSQLHFLEL